LLDRRTCQAIVLALLMSFPGYAQQQTPYQGLKIIVLEGNDAVNSITRNVAIPPVVEVRDADNRPIEGASVTFELPSSGPGAFFPGRVLTKTVITNSQGQAAATGLMPNGQAGSFDITVTAKFGNETRTTLIRQTNSTGEALLRAGKPSGFPWKKVLLISGGAAAAAVTAILLTRDGNSTPTVTINPGSVIIGGGSR
jgi:hypothetical protein